MGFWFLGGDCLVWGLACMVGLGFVPYLQDLLSLKG